MHVVNPDDPLEKTPDVRPVWRREYDTLMLRFDDIDRQLSVLPALAELCRASADNSLKAHDMAQRAFWMRSSWAPFIVSALAFAMSFASLVMAILVYGLVRR